MIKIICITLLLLYGITMLMVCCYALFKGPENRVHFYIARDMDGKLWLYLGKPIRVESEFNITEDRKVTVLSSNLKRFGLNEEDYTYLKWENEPVEVFLNLEN